MKNNKIEVGNFSFSKKSEATFKSKDTLVEYYWHYHPRFQFFKTVPENSKLLDVGASSGGLSFWKDWSFPHRMDIQMFAIDLEEGIHFDRYEDFQLVNLDAGKIKFSNEQFDAILMSHVLEHISDIEHVLGEIYRVLKPGGKAYFEIPSPETLNFPQKKEFNEQGINVTTTNFWDDHTHIRTYTLDELQHIMIKNNFTVLCSGKIQNSYLESELYTLGINNDDQELISYGIWSMLRWAQYLIVEK